MKQDFNYREYIYQNCLSRKACLRRQDHSSKEYLQWAAAARVRLRGWLPYDLKIPVLDMGCGPGYFLYMLEKLGYTNLTGVDINPINAELARSHCTHSKIINSDVRKILKENPGKFGLITGFDFIEHFSKNELFPLLELIVKSLQPRGRLILQTPNAESPFGGNVAYGDLTHEWFFTPSSLKEILTQIGLLEFEARPSEPYIHGLKSLLRVVVWKGIKGILAICNLAETGTISSGIYSRVFCATAVKVKEKN